LEGNEGSLLRSCQPSRGNGSSYYYWYRKKLILAFPFLPNLKIPKSIDFGRVVFYQPRRKVINLTNDIPVDFDFDITFNRELPPNYFTIAPMTGTLRGLETLKLVITFMPLTLCQAQLEFSFRTSQERGDIKKCLVFGTGEIDLPKAPQEKIVLEPIAPTLIENMTSTKKEVNISFSMDSHQVEKEATEDLFQMELEENVSEEIYLSLDCVGQKKRIVSICVNWKGSSSR
jgi:hypothetical protein